MQCISLKTSFRFLQRTFRCLLNIHEFSFCMSHVSSFGSSLRSPSKRLNLFSIWCKQYFPSLNNLIKVNKLSCFYRRERIKTFFSFWILSEETSRSMGGFAIDRAINFKEVPVRNISRDFRETSSSQLLWLYNVFPNQKTETISEVRTSKAEQDYKKTY